MKPDPRHYMTIHETVDGLELIELRAAAVAFGAAAAFGLLAGVGLTVLVWAITGGCSQHP